MEREGISTLSIRGFPRALRGLLFLKFLGTCILKKKLFYFVITLVSVPKSVTKLFLKTVLKVFV